MKRYLSKFILSLLTFLVLGSLAFSQTTFNYTGGMQTFTAPTTGNYQFDCWGAQGGSGLNTIGGYGGFASGIYSLTAGQTINIFVGGQGGSYAGPIGWNGGGQGGIDTAGQNGGSGGGASDIRIAGTAFGNRIIVAGGGAGGGRDDSTGAGGGLIGTASSDSYGVGFGGTGGTQTSGGIAYITSRGATNGTLGIGGDGSTNFYSAGGGGGGGGYFGGGGGTSTVDHGSGFSSGGGGGSSYIDGVTSSSTSTGVQAGNGQIVITALCSPSTITPNIASLPDVTGQCSVAAPTAPTATDNCGTIITGTTATSFPITTQGTIVVTWTYTSGSVTTTQTQNVVIDDVTAPVADIATLADVTAECSVTSLVAPTATDNCGGVVTVTNNAVLPITLQGTTVVTWTYDDGNGNTSTQTQNVVIDDVTAPVITCQAPISVNNDLGACGAVVNWINPTVTDNCNSTFSDELILNGSFESGAANWSFNNGNGISGCGQPWLATNNMSPCQSIPAPLFGTNAAVTAFDGSGPTTYTISQTITVPLGIIDADLYWNQAYSVSNCGSADRVFSVAFYDATNTVLIGTINTQNLTPVCGATQGWTNFTNDITALLTAQQGNVLNLRFSAYIPENYTGPAAFGIDQISLIVSSAVSIVTVTQTAGLASGSVFPVGTTTNTFVASDASGNTSTCSFNVVVTDNEAPVADIATLADVTAECSVTSLVAPTATDNCAGVVTVTNNAVLPISGEGTTTVVTWTYDDGNGNTSTQTQNVIINDVTNPTVVGQNITISLDSFGDASITALMIENGSVDNCGVASFSIDITSFNCSNEGVNNVVLTVIDINGNTSATTYQVTVLNTFGDNDIDGIKDNCDDDDDNDGVLDGNDNCPLDSNSDQADNDTDGLGDVCDDDDDNDGLIDTLDNCQFIYNPSQDDRDNDGIGDVCDLIEVNVSEAITPNGDGINDTWMIYNIENYPNSSVRVFNRWGSEVFFAKGYQNDWNGSYKNNSQPLPDSGSYYYQLDLNGNGSTIKDGWIYITRK